MPRVRIVSDVCWTDNPEGFDECMAKCRMYTEDDRREQCEENCIILYCCDEPMCEDDDIDTQE